MRVRSSGASSVSPSRSKAKPQATMQASTSRVVPSLSVSTRSSGRDSTRTTSTPSLIGITPSTCSRSQGAAPGRRSRALIFMRAVCGRRAKASGWIAKRLIGGGPKPTTG